ncbi:streptophobe family protein [Plantactinospora veratri]
MSGPQPRDVLEGALAVIAAFVVMTGVAALSLHLLDAASLGSPVAMTAAVVALANGGSVTFSMDVGGSAMPISAALGGSMDVMPLGLTMVGAVVLAAGFLLPLRRRIAIGGSALFLRASSAVLTYVTVVAIAAKIGHGTIRLGDGRGGTSPDGADPRAGGRSGLGDILRNRGGRGNGSEGGGGLRDLFGNRGGSGPGGGRDLGNILSGGGDVTYTTSLATSILHGMACVLLVLALCWLASRRTPLPVEWNWLDRTIRPVVSVVATVAVGITLLGLLSGLVLGFVAPNGDKMAGGILLGLPNLVVVLLTVGIGVSWRLDAGGILGDRILPALQKRLPTGEGGLSLSLDSLSGMDRPVWVLPVAISGLVLLGCGILAAARTPRQQVDDAGTARGSVRRSLGLAATLGILLALLLPVLTTVSGASADVGVDVFGFNMRGATLNLGGSAGPSFLAGLLAGAVAGFLGGLIVELLRSVRARRQDPAPHS